MSEHLKYLIVFLDYKAMKKFRLNEKKKTYDEGIYTTEVCCLILAV